MPKLRPTSIQRLTHELEATRFGLVGFDVKFPDTFSVFVTITFVGVKGFSLKIGESGSNTVYVTSSPGEYKVEDTYTFESFDDAIKCVQPWARRIYEDLRVRSPDLGEFAAFRQTLDAHLKSNIPDEQSLFTHIEVNDLTSKLSALEQRLAEMEERHVITEKELKDLSQVVSEARKDLLIMPKGVWYRTAGGKLWEVMKKTAGTNEGRQVLADAARKLLGL